MAILSVDLSHVPDDVRRAVDDLVRRNDREAYERAVELQRRIAKLYNENPPPARDGLGPCNMVMVPYLRNMLSAVYGPECWDDEGFRKWLLKRHEEFRVRERGTKIQVGPR